MNKTLTLWSLRPSVARGNYFKAEREVSSETYQQWLDIFRKDEPEVLFIVCHKMPKL